MMHFIKNTTNINNGKVKYVFRKIGIVGSSSKKCKNRQKILTRKKEKLSYQTFVHCHAV
jgi:hypothetical protein